MHFFCVHVLIMPFIFVLNMYFSFLFDVRVIISVSKFRHFVRDYVVCVCEHAHIIFLFLKTMLY